MIITCNNCNKKFNIDGNLIPEKGRLLQCSSCNHKWFFTNEIITEMQESTIIKNHKDSMISINEKEDDLVDNKEIENDQTIINKNLNENLDEPITKEKKGKINVLGLGLVFIISFIALIILADTFQQPISMIIPNIEFLLYNLYESIKDITLFFEDLI
jgi:predicted Zn finger-like uncharacterized protein